MVEFTRSDYFLCVAIHSIQIIFLKLLFQAHWEFQLTLEYVVHTTQQTAAVVELRATINVHW